MKQDIIDALIFYFRTPPKEMLRRIKERDLPWIVQLGVYGFCGILATVVSVGIIVLLSTTVIPAYEGMIVNGEPLTKELRAKNLLINNGISFFITNFFVYYMNVMLVFKRGRHSPWMEFLYFTLINLIAFVISQVAGPELVRRFDIPTNIAIFSNTVAAALINFVARKFFVFKG
ncbi:GtrA family protein [Phragmitibacter flavus]|uniref:GtrA family protein n=1 Tax=Phragmitibacter flavus TaxID=2576071 RepID=A0A5R8KGW1_9BACT|nr:GtrA family protein [Phragmitibacter flavus]TLD70839.1 GtrA family protein [Phragmitibacter flavus]